MTSPSVAGTRAFRSTPRCCWERPTHDARRGSSAHLNRSHASAGPRNQPADRAPRTRAPAQFRPLPDREGLAAAALPDHAAHVLVALARWSRLRAVRRRGAGDGHLDVENDTSRVMARAGTPRPSTNTRCGASSTRSRASRPAPTCGAGGALLFHAACSRVGDAGPWVVSSSKFTFTFAPCGWTIARRLVAQVERLARRLLVHDVPVQFVRERPGDRDLDLHHARATENGETRSLRDRPTRSARCPSPSSARARSACRAARATCNARSLHERPVPPACRRSKAASRGSPMSAHRHHGAGEGARAQTASGSASTETRDDAPCGAPRLPQLRRRAPSAISYGNRPSAEAASRTGKALPCGARRAAPGRRQCPCAAALRRLRRAPLTVRAVGPRSLRRPARWCSARSTARSRRRGSFNPAVRRTSSSASVRAERFARRERALAADGERPFAARLRRAPHCHRRAARTRAARTPAAPSSTPCASNATKPRAEPDRRTAGTAVPQRDLAAHRSSRRSSSARGGRAVTDGRTGRSAR